MAAAQPQPPRFSSPIDDDAHTTDHATDSDSDASDALFDDLDDFLHSLLPSTAVDPSAYPAPYASDGNTLCAEDSPLRESPLLGFYHDHYSDDSDDELADPTLTTARAPSPLKRGKPGMKSCPNLRGLPHLTKRQRREDRAEFHREKAIRQALQDTCRDRRQSSSVSSPFTFISALFLSTCGAAHMERHGASRHRIRLLLV
jgi:hypothetical protein